MSGEQSRPRKSPLLEQTRRLMRTRHLSIRTEEAYLRWIEEFLRYHRDQQGEWVHPGNILLILSRSASPVIANP